MLYLVNIVHILYVGLDLFVNSMYTQVLSLYLTKSMPFDSALNEMEHTSCKRFEMVSAPAVILRFDQW